MVLTSEGGLPVLCGRTEVKGSRVVARGLLNSDCCLPWLMGFGSSGCSGCTHANSGAKTMKCEFCLCHLSAMGL